MEFKILVGMVIIIRFGSGSSAVAYAQGDRHDGTYHSSVRYSLYGTY